MTTITWIEATHGSPIYRKLWAFLEQAVVHDTRGRAEVNYTHLPRNGGGIRTPANRLINDAAVVAAAVHESEKSDAVIIGCWGAPTEAVRSALNQRGKPTPVTSLPEAAARLVGSLAQTAVVITVAPSLVPIFEEDLRGLGASGFHSSRPVRSYDPESTLDDVEAATHDPQALIERFDEEARAAVADGADAIVVGCGYLGPIFTRAGYTHVSDHPHVPIIDSCRLAMEHALTLVELQKIGIIPTQQGFPAPAGSQAQALHDYVDQLYAAQS